MRKNLLSQHIHRISVTALALGSVICNDAFAQESAAQTRGVLETITVTAERREADITDVPVSVSVLGNEYLEAIGTSGGDVRILASKVPSLNVESSNGRTFPRFYIRGYGNTDFSSFASQPVSLVYDDIVLENPALKGFPIFDLANVEVLRGPQGTLFGRNTPAGVVKFNSAKPVIGSSEGYVNLSTATYNTSNVEGAFNLPINDEWAARFSALYQHRDDFVDNVIQDTNGNTVRNSDAFGGYDDSAARFQLLYEPSEGDFSALFNLHVRNIDDGTARLFRANIIEKGDNDLVPGFDPEEISIDGENTQSYTSVGGSARLQWDLNENYTLHSITGYESVTHYFTRGDVDAGFGASFAPPFGPGFIPFSVETAGGLDDHEQITQELRIESTLPTALNWQAGVFYFYEDVTDNSFTYDTLFGGDRTLQQSNQENTAWAIFGSLTYDVSDDLQLSGGLRYTYDDKDFTQSINSPAEFKAGGDESEVTWDLSAHYSLNDDVALYARVATGFRAPSFGSLSSTGDEITFADSETILSYETGIKTELFDRRARLNFNVYYYEVSDQQLTAVGGTSNQTALINADETTGQGFELDFEAYITENLFVTIGGSYNDTEINDPSLSVSGCGSDADGRLCNINDPLVIGPNGEETFSIDGNPLPQAAEWIGNATVRYEYPLTDGSQVYAFADFAYTSEVNFFLYESEEFESEGLFETGLRLGYNWGGGKYDAALFCRNCTDETRVTGAIDFNNRTGFVNDPRVIGAQFKASF